MNKGEILALVQMSNCSTTEDEIKKEKVKPKNSIDEKLTIDQMIMTAAAEFYFASEDKPIVQEDVPNSAKTLPVIIEARETPTLPKIQQRSSVISSPQTAAPTSVIVRRQEKQPRAVTKMIFSQQNEPKAVTEMLFSQWNEPKAVTEMLFSQKNEPKAVTEMLFSMKSEPKTERDMSDRENVAVNCKTESLFSMEEREENDTEEKGFFDELLFNLDQIDNLEYLAPYAGDACIPLNIKSPREITPSISPSSPMDNRDSMETNGDLDDVIVIKFDENFSPLFDDDDEGDIPNPDMNVFLNPDKNLMWSHCGGTNSIKKPRKQNPDPAPPPPSEPGFMIDDVDLKQFLEIHSSTRNHAEDYIQRVSLSTPPHNNSMEKCPKLSPCEDIFFVPKKSEKNIF